MSETRSEEIARHARAHALRMVHRARASHIGAALSMIDLLAVLYDGVLDVDPRRPDRSKRDRLIVSKGHAAVGLYAVLAEVGFIEAAELETYGSEGSRLLGHVSHHVPGVEMSTGSLGHGLPVACGLAKALPESRVVVICGDGEMGEGSNWEALLFAAHHKLGNLTLIIDANGIQGTGDVADVLRLDPLEEKLRAFGWRVAEIDGHSHRAIRDALSAGRDTEFRLRREASRMCPDHALSEPPSPYPLPPPARPSASLAGAPQEEGEHPHAVVARTVKGKGVDFMENSLDWHYKSPNDEQLEEALRQVAA